MRTFAWPLVALALLPACRTAHTPSSSTASLEYAVVLSQGREVYVWVNDERPVRGMDLQLDSTELVFTTRRPERTQSVDRRDVRRIAAAPAVGGVVLGGIAVGAATAYALPVLTVQGDCGDSFGCAIAQSLTSVAVGVAGFAAGSGLFAKSAPDRAPVFYNAPRR